ncbi:MAG: M15 family metallopeptidase, partial [Anaerovoracaceae bacterium]
MRNKLLVTYFVMALFLCLSICAFSGCENQKDRYDTEGFVMVREVVPNVIEEIRYYGDYNFVGEPIDGYNAPVALLTREAAEALRIAADRFEAEGYVIKIYDAYRPQRATEAFL